ncbi:hypothetical protein PAXRUDRAFT_831833 [Paxillus rubicundulus Ve08.2h10]|uniref:Uncharacterized protein n=1 Tax=Paxillus rubicundulus Ve08.2h10 TaxID=930991 RepID=A0A0D0DTB3_9AGAM|nr:hypothetical protein PAXRUDRAFT_831833 [Paxillus rubicundulus Ve08.2h10]
MEIEEEERITFFPGQCRERRTNEYADQIDEVKTLIKCMRRCVGRSGEASCLGFQLVVRRKADQIGQKEHEIERREVTERGVSKRQTF